MSIITFWNSGREQVGKTLAIASIVTQYSMLHNKKVLIISTSFNDDTLKRCFWGEEKAKKKTGFFDRKPTVGIENGIDGLVKIMNSNKIMPNIITDYTKIVFKDRLEILPGYVGEEQGYKEIQENYAELIKMANQYYDLVFVDLDEQVNTLNKNEILRKSDVILYAMSQRMKSINDYNDVLDDFDDTLDSKKVLPILCRYDKKSKYTAKNISRFLGQKNNMLTVPYNTLFFEATEEGKLVDFLLRIRNVDENDKNAFFLSEIKRASETIIYKVEELQMR
jgi:hypothetical protein